jgi:hypothetical protein
MHKITSKALNVIILVLSLSLLSYKTSKKTDPSIAFIHLGPTLPDYLATAITQARLFNPTLNIYLVAEPSALSSLPLELENAHITPISTAMLRKSHLHKRFQKKSRLDKHFREGFWMFTTERFFYLADLIQQYKLRSVFHLENDVMLYTDLKELLPIFTKSYRNKIGATFDNDERCIPGFVYIPTSTPLNCFIRFIMQHLKNKTNDMQLLGQFQKKCQGKWIQHLPLFIPHYADDHPLVSTNGMKGSNKIDFFQSFEAFRSIFDGAALGQYLGGIDPRNGISTPGFINEACIFNPSHFEFKWEKDSQGREVPMMIYKSCQCKINNLHIHSKELFKFKS